MDYAAGDAYHETENKMKPTLFEAIISVNYTVSPKNIHLVFFIIYVKNQLADFWQSYS